MYMQIQTHACVCVCLCVCVADLHEYATERRDEIEILTTTATNDALSYLN